MEIIIATECIEKYAVIGGTIMGLKTMLQNTDLKKILKPILPTQFTFTTNLDWNIEAFSKNYKLLVTNELTDKGDAKLVGIAFDYMARFIIANHIEHNKKSALQNMVCGKVFDKLKNVLTNDLLDKYKIWYVDIITRIEDYIMNGSNGYYNIIPDVLTLARFEQIWRVYGIGDITSILKHGNIKNLELGEDLKKNCEIFEKVFIESGLVKKNSTVVFNPNFGVWSYKCFGADADIFIDDVLYDFKCVTKNGYRIDDVAQICGYYLLHRLTQMTDNEDEFEDEGDAPVPLKNMTIKAIALYKSRFGAIEQYNVNKFDKEEFELVLEQVREFINKYYYTNIETQFLMYQFFKDKQ